MPKRKERSSFFCGTCSTQVHTQVNNLLKNRAWLKFFLQVGSFTVDKSQNYKDYLPSYQVIHVQHIHNCGLEVCCSIITLQHNKGESCNYAPITLKPGIYTEVMESIRAKTQGQLTVDIKQLSSVGSLTGSYLS